MKPRKPFFFSETSAQTQFSRGARIVRHGFVNQIYSGRDLRARTVGFSSAAYNFDLQPTPEEGVFSMTDFLAAHCPRDEVSLIREASLVYTRQMNEAARLIGMRTPPIIGHIMGLQADLDQESIRRFDTILLRRRSPKDMVPESLLDDLRSLARMFR